MLNILTAVGLPYIIARCGRTTTDQFFKLLPINFLNSCIELIMTACMDGRVLVQVCLGIDWYAFATGSAYQPPHEGHVRFVLARIYFSSSLNKTK